MVSSFALQLQAIASKSSNELDLKARRNAHAESLIFEKETAAKQDFETIYNICIEGFNELCQLDSRFHDFDRNLFAEQAKAQDREELTASQNEALDVVLKRCLMLLGSKILLKPALKALEWLVRRFRVHVYNINDLLHTLLPYHEVSIWANTLSIVPPAKVSGQWKFIRPYLNTTWNVPRHAIAHAASNNDAFFAQLNAFTLELCHQGFDNTIYMRFWSGIIVEAISTRLAQTKSGRKEVQAQRVEDLLLKILPVLNEGYEISGSTDLITTCYTITIVLAARAELGDPVLDSLLLEICQSLRNNAQMVPSALLTISMVIPYKESLVLPRRVLTTLSGLNDFDALVRNTSIKQSCQYLLDGLVRSAISYIKGKNARQMANFITVLVHLTSDLYPKNLMEGAILPVLSKSVRSAQPNGAITEVRDELVAVLQNLNKTEKYSIAISQAAAFAKFDSDQLEALLGMTVEYHTSLSRPEDDDVLMQDAPGPIAEPSESISESLPSTWQHGSSFLAVNVSETFYQISEAFEAYATTPDTLKKFTNLPIWSSVPNGRLLWQTFLIRFASSTYQSQARQKALRLLSDEFDAQLGCDVQFFIPYLLMLLTDIKAVRQGSSNLLNKIQDSTANKSIKGSEPDFYGPDAIQHVVPLPQKQVTSLLTDVICPVLEECVLDQNHVIKIVQNALQANSTTDVKKNHRQALFNMLTQHALATPLIRLTATSVSMIGKVQKVGGKSKIKMLLPVLQNWSKSSVSLVDAVARESGLSVEQIDALFVQLTDVHDGHYLDQISQDAESSDSSIRPGLVRALFNYMRQDWHSWTADEHLSSAGTLFNIAFATSKAFSAGAQDVLRSVELSSEVLATLLQLSEAGSSNVKGPPSKKKRRSSSGASQSRIDVVRTIDNTTAKISLALELVESNTPETKPELLTVMFEMLACLKQLQQNRVESPYLLNLCLSSIHAMIRPLSSRGSTADLSGIKPELVTECLRSTDNPQVQNTSLLVMAALSSIIPDRMVHNVMPIFTFIGHNMLSKDDEHSINVVNEAIDKIVPALLQSLRKGKNVQTYQASMSTMLASFTSAYEHIPQHRRVVLYQKLLFSIDASEFGFVLVALLAAQEGRREYFSRFLEDFIGALPPSIQLTIYQKLVLLSVDVLSSSPKTATVVYNLGRTTSAKEKSSYARSNLMSAIIILQNSKLASAIKTRAKLDRAPTGNTEEQLRISFETTLTATRDLKDGGDGVVTLAKQCLDALLQLPRMVDLLNMLRATLDNMEETQLRPQALRVLSLQLRSGQKKDLQTRESALSFVPTLNAYVRPNDNIALVQASLACLNCIAEVYGRRNPELIVSVAENIIAHGLLAFKTYSRVLEAVVLTIASVVEATKEGFVPLVSETISQTLSVLSERTRETIPPSLFRAACSLLSAVVSNAAFIISQEQLRQILDITIAAQAVVQQPDTEDDFSLLIRSIAQKVEIEMIVEASATILEEQKSPPESIASVILNMLGQAIEASSKTTVIRQAESISQLLKLVLSVRATSIIGEGSQHAEDNDAALLDQLKSTNIKFVYKINDTTLRPIFESWIDWATSSDDTNASHAVSLQVNRQITLFEVLVHFFDTLKSIVTSYATYLLTPMSTILKSANSANLSTRPNDNLLTNCLTLLRTITIHDQDQFFSAPSHFDPIVEPLITTLNLASTKARRPLVYSHIVPAITGLATATMDSPTTHNALVHFLVGLKSHNSSHVRLASIRTLLALTEDEELGDEFIANTIGIGAGEGEGARGGGSSVGEIMVYVNEMLEDDDEDVEMEVRRWVQVVRGKVGEDVFEV